MRLSRHSASSSEAIRKQHRAPRTMDRERNRIKLNQLLQTRSQSHGARFERRWEHGIRLELEQASAYFHRDDEPCPRGIFAMRNTQPDRKRRVILAEATDASHVAILIAIPINCRSCNTRALSLMWDGDKSAPGVEEGLVTSKVSATNSRTSNLVVSCSCGP